MEHDRNITTTIRLPSALWKQLKGYCAAASVKEGRPVSLRELLIIGAHIVLGQDAVPADRGTERVSV